MLSDEEKKAIESLKNIAIYIGDNYTFSQQGIRNLRENLRIVLPVIEKQSKEIEEYKKQLDLDNECEIALNSKVMDLEKEIEELKDTRSIFNIGRRSYKNEIEDKIKAKIEELEIEQESNREDLKIAIDNLVFSNIDKIANKISINMSIRGILQSLLEKEE